MTNFDVLPAFNTVAPDLHRRVSAAVVPAERSVAELRDAELLAAVVRGDEAAFETLYGLHESAVRSAANAICRQPAATDDIVQKTFLALWERAARLALRSVRLRPWLVTVARNAAIDHLRAERPLAAFDSQHEAGAQTVCPQDLAVNSALMRDLAPALDALPAAQHTVIVARYFEGRTFADIAARTGEPLGTVKSRARLAIEALRRAIAE